MTITTLHRRILIAVSAATVALATAGAGQAGAVGGPEYGIVPAPGSLGVHPQLASAGSARRPLPPESRVANDVFDWSDAGVGAAGAGMILGVLGGAVLLLRGHPHPAGS
jgi:hypothetical protein